MPIGDRLSRAKWGSLKTPGSVANVGQLRDAQCPKVAPPATQLLQTARASQLRTRVEMGNFKGCHFCQIFAREVA
jgi:hypothetical protein